MLTERDGIPILAWSKSKNKPIVGQATDQSGVPEVHHDHDQPHLHGEGIWSALPEDLTDRIFSRLPLPSILRLRCVSKRLNSLVVSENFLDTIAKNSIGRPINNWFIMCTMGRAACSYDPWMKKWHRIVSPANDMGGTSVLAVAGSLLCLGNQVAECRALSICNPITKALRHLPPMLQVRLIHKVSMITDRFSNSYKIMVSGENATLPTRNPYAYELLTEVYDSSVNSWRMSGRPSRDAKFGSDPGAWCNGMYYCITELPYGVAVFDLKTESWSELRLQMPATLTSPSLVESHGRLLMIGRVLGDPQADRRAIAVRITIWELQFGRKEWVEVRTAPMDVCREFMAPLAFHSPFVCAGLGNQIYITTHLNPNVLVHDLSINTWQWLPSDPFFPNKRDFHLVGFALEPTLDACP